MTKAPELVNNRKIDFASELEIATFDADDLIALAKMQFPNQPLTVEMVLSCGNFETDENTVLIQAIGVKLKATETAKETNEKDLSMEAITNFVNGLKFEFGVTKEKVLERLKTSLTTEKLKNLMYFQDNGHQLDVTAVTAAGELEFDTCSIESPEGEHRNKNYYQALELATQNGATLMTRDKYNRIGKKFDPNTWSWLFSPKAGTLENHGRAFDSKAGLVCSNYYPYRHSHCRAFRVSLRV